MQGLVAVWRRRRAFKEDKNVVEEGESVGDARLYEKVGEVEKVAVKGAGCDGETFEKDEGLFEVDLAKADETFDSSGEGIVSVKIVGERLHDGFLKSGDGLLAKSCDHDVHKGGGA